MTTLTMRYVRGHFVVTAPDIEPVIQVAPRSKGVVHRTSSWFTHPGSRRQLVQAGDQAEGAETGVSEALKAGFADLGREWLRLAEQA